MRHYHFIISSCFLLASLLCRAEAGSDQTNARACLDAAINQGALINTHRIQCLHSELVAQEDLLKKLYNAQISTLRRDKRNLLSINQSQWFAYRNSWCRYETTVKVSGPHPAVTDLFCRIDLTVNRVNQLAALAN